MTVKMGTKEGAKETNIAVLMAADKSGEND